MNWFTTLLTSTIGRKVVMALTGLFLILFLVVHLIGNLQLLHSDGGQAFNVYAKFMTSNPLIKTVSYLNYTFILVHAIWALLLTIHNKKARGPEGYAVSKNSSAWTSRNMGILGSIIFIFIIVHLQNFWAQMHFGNLQPKDYGDGPVKDLYTIVNDFYNNPAMVGLYVFSMLILAFHLWHGFASSFQTLGLNHLKYNGVINFVGKAFAIIVPALFALIPIWMYLD